MVKEKKCIILDMGGQISAYNWVRSFSNRISNIGFSLPFSHSCFEV